MLERLQGFMRPLRLTKPLTVRTAQCGAETEPYKSGGPVTICYELVQHIAAVAAKHTQDPKERAQILNGTFVQAVLHQLAYAVFDELQVPIWGREADAADHVAALIMMEFGDQVALTTILGTVKFFEYSGKDLDRCGLCQGRIRRPRSASTTISASPMAAIRSHSVS